MGEFGLLKNYHSFPHMTVHELHAYPHPHRLLPLAPLNWEISQTRHAWKVYLVGLMFNLWMLGYCFTLFFYSNYVMGMCCASLVTLPTGPLHSPGTEPTATDGDGK